MSSLYEYTLGMDSWIAFNRNKKYIYTNKIKSWDSDATQMPTWVVPDLAPLTITTN